MLLILLTSSLVINVMALDRPHYDVSQAEKLFENFILSHGKSYPRQEKQVRFEIFKENLNTINDLNAKGNAVFDINRYTDFTKEEMYKVNGFKLSDTEDDCQVLTDNDITTNSAPDSIDWVKNGGVTSAKNQDDPKFCSACYAFTAIGIIEGQYFIKHNTLEEFSVQQILDCSMSNFGCVSGYVARALTDLKNAKGVELASTYPYIADLQVCQFNVTRAVAKISSCTKYNLTDEAKLKELVGSKGPIAVAVAANSAWKHYTGGILSAEQCGSTLGHTVVIVGYGTENGTDYWKIKDSSGADFGENGYIRIGRGENACKLMNEHITSVDVE